jgi:hypothetical protein
MWSVDVRSVKVKAHTDELARDTEEFARMKLHEKLASIMETGAEEWLKVQPKNKVIQMRLGMLWTTGPNAR